MKPVLAFLSLVAITTGAFASEATQFVDPPSMLTRAEVRAAIGAPSNVMHLGEATVFVDPAPATARVESPMLARARGRIVDSRNFSESYSPALQ
jgi:hypothetical protein